MPAGLSTSLPSAGDHYLKYSSHVSTWWVWNHNNKDKSFPTNSTLHWCRSRGVFNKPCCLIALNTVCVCLQLIFLAKVKETTTPLGGNEVLQPGDITLGPLLLYHPSRHILLTPCESCSPLSDGCKCVKCEIWQWDDTETRRWRTQSASFSVPWTAFPPFPVLLTLKSIKRHSWLLGEKATKELWLSWWDTDRLWLVCTVTDWFWKYSPCRANVIPRCNAWIHQMIRLGVNEVGQHF